jgi:hypothetical protein
MSLAPACWRDLIVAGRGRKSSASFDTTANCHFVNRREWWLEKRIRTIEGFAVPTGVVKRRP